MNPRLDLLIPASARHLKRDENKTIMGVWAGRGRRRLFRAAAAIGRGANRANSGIRNAADWKDCGDHVGGVAALHLRRRTGDWHPPINDRRVGGGKRWNVRALDPEGKNHGHESLALITGEGTPAKMK